MRDPIAEVDSGGERAERSSRVAWIDSVRALSVLAVVVFHVVRWDPPELAADVNPVGSAIWGTVDSVLGGVRMPVLLAVSGLVVARHVRQDAFLDGTLLRGVRNYYLYVVWLAVYMVWYLVFTLPDLPHRVDGPADALRQLAVPATTLWYLVGLALYVLILGLVRHARPWVVLGPLAVVSVGVHALTFPDALWNKIPEEAFFFAVGVYGARWLRALAERTSPAVVALSLVVAFGSIVAGRALPEEISDDILFLPRGLAFVALVVASAGLLERWTAFRRVGHRLGRQTLPIYVLHPLLIAALLTGLNTSFGTVVAEARRSAAGSVLWPVVVVVLIAVVALYVRELADRVHLGFLFVMPRSLSSSITRFAGRGGRQEKPNTV